MFLFSFTKVKTGNDNIISYTADPMKQDIQLYWKDDKGNILHSLQNLKTFVEGKQKKLVFGMNGGMYKPDGTAQGLFIQNKKTIEPIDKGKGGNGNFYLKPNGIFYITSDKKAAICTTPDFKNNGNVAWATQSGPMLVIDGALHSAFKEGSSNVNIRNGVGILPDGKIVFAISKGAINFYDFAMYFKNLGCKNALYLDGFVSRMYAPEKDREQLSGTFGVIIGITK